jgi:dephospho-CoA kinase
MPTAATVTNPVSRATEDNPLKKIALTGGIGTGKSLVSQCLREDHGYCVWDADTFAREALLDPVIQQQLVDFFGAGVRNAQGHISRTWLRDRLFAHPEELPFLEGVLHPKIAQIHDAKAQTLEALAPNIWYFYEASLIFEVGRAHLFDACVVVSCEDALRFERLQKQRKLSVEQIQRVMSHQWPESEKRAKADFVLENNLDQTHLKGQVQVLLNFLSERFQHDA